MSTDLKKAIESLTNELQSVMEREANLKRTINELSILSGETAPYSDVGGGSVAGVVRVQSDQFFGKTLTAAIKEYLGMRRRAATAEEIYTVLKEGGFEFPGDEKFQHRGVAVSLSKNRRDFVYIKSSNSYGLWDFYPAKLKEREKLLAEAPEADESKNETLKDEAENNSKDTK